MSNNKNCKIYSRSRIKIFKNKQLGKKNYKKKYIYIIITNEETTKAMQGYTYKDMFTIERDESGEIQMINANIITIDEITSNISNYIQEALKIVKLKI